MIELTKQQFDDFLANVNMTGYVTNMVISRQVVKPNQPNRIATGMGFDKFGAIYVYAESNFRYNTPSISTAYAIYAPNLPSTVRISEDNNGLVLTSQMPQQTMYVIYFLKDETIDSTRLFTNVDLVSVDYVGLDVRQLSFPGNYQHLEEINLYVGGREGITGLFTGMDITDSQYLYYGVNYGENGGAFNRFVFEKGAFKGSKIKKLLLPVDVDIPDELCTDCTDLLEVVCEGTHNIGKNAFKGCTNLQSFYNQVTVSTMGDGAFDGCVNLKDIHIPYGDPTGTMTQYFGLRGCIMKHEMVNGSVKLSIVFANNWWWDGVKNHITECGFVQSRMAYSMNKLYPGTYTDDTLAPMVNMIYTDGTGTLVGTLVVDDFINNSGHGTTHGLLVTSSNIDQITASLIGPPVGKVGDRFLIPLCWFVDEIMPNACAGDTNITSVDLSNFYCLTNIGNSAFKGCTGITEINLGENSFGFMTIGVSAFEKCTGFNSLTITKRLFLSDKSFFGCSNLEYLDFGGFGNTMDMSSNPSLVFGNTPSLASITANYNSGSGQIAYYNGTPLNAILATNQSGTSADRILVGCKSTDFQTIRTQYSCTKIGAGAFYGCTSLEINGNRQMLNGYTQVLDSGFYGCTGIVSNNNGKVIFKTLSVIGPNAFYGCTNLETLDLTAGTGGAAGYIQIGTKAFANSGVKRITVGTEPYIQTIADDAFENCVLSDVNVENSNNSILRDSVDTSENSLLKRTTSGGSVVAMLKSGNGKEIVNSVYNHKNISEIKSNAFTGVTMGSGNNTTIHIPASVGTLGKTIMSNTKLNASNGLGTLQLDGGIVEKNECLRCDGVSIGLLYAVGGKYFKNLVEKTLDNYQNDKTYYAVEQREGELISLDVIEHSGVSDTCVLSVYYNEERNMMLQINAVPNCNYAADDDSSHITGLEEPIRLMLMHDKQAYTPAEQSVYCDADLMPGTFWIGIDALIPEVESTCSPASRTEYDSYNSLGNSFANCGWISNVVSSRRLSGLTNGFSGCTALQSIRPYSYETLSTIDYPLFDGQVPNGMFSGCTNFEGIAPTAIGMKMVYPIEYGNNSFYKCKRLSPATIESLKLATDFGAESFAETNLISIDLMSALKIDATAFKSCNLVDAQATNTTGEFFTGAGGHCIVNQENRIVVGTPAVVIDADCTGIQDFAFYGRTKGSAWSVTPSNKNNFYVGKSAFAESDLTQYTETGCVHTRIDEEAFTGCVSLTTVMFIGNNASVTLGKKSYKGCTALATLTLPRGTDIPESAFAMCNALTSVVASGGVEKGAFEKCTNLATVRFDYDQNSTQRIDPTAFVSCPIASFTFTSGVTASYTFTQNTVSRWNTEGHLELVLGTSTFNYIEIPKYYSLKIIGDHAYDGRGLSGVITIPGSVTEIGDYAFANNPGITAINIPPTVERIGDHAFDGCTNLKRFTLPDELNYLGEGILKGCNLSEGVNCNYEDVRIWNDDSGRPVIGGVLGGLTGFDSVLDLRDVPFTTIGVSAFEESEIKNVYIGDSITLIDESAFKNCQELSQIHFVGAYTDGGVVTPNPRINNYAFYGCNNLGDIYIHSAYCIPNANTSMGWDYEVGHNVPAGKRHIHIPPAANTQAFRSSTFVTALLGRSFTIVADL